MLCLRSWVLVGVGVLAGAEAGVAQRPGQAPARSVQAPVRGAQAPPRGAAAAHGPGSGANRFAAEPAVFEQLDTNYTYAADGTGTRLETARVRVQNEAGVRSLAYLSAPFSAATGRAEFAYARVRKPNGTVVETAAMDAQDQPAALTLAAPAYSDLHLLILPVKGLAVGDVLEFQVKSSMTQAAVPGQIFGGEPLSRGRVILRRTVTLSVPGGKKLLVDSGALTPVIREEKGERVFAWTSAQLTPTQQGRGDAAGAGSTSPPPPEAATADLTLRWTTFTSWAEVGAWYAGLLGPATAISPSVKARADQVIYRAATPEARAEALYRFVSQEIRSINVPLGQGSYQPHTADETLSNQYGDSKDKAVLLTAMLRAEGIAADPALVGAGSEVLDRLPAPFWFSQLVTLVHLAPSDDVWLDPMPEVAPFGILGESLRDRRALVIPRTGDATLRQTPVDLPFPATVDYRADGTLNREGRLTAHVSLTLRGDEELRYRTALHALGPGGSDRVAEAFAAGAGLHGTVSNAGSDAPEETGKPLHMRFDFEAAPYGDWTNFRIVPPEPGLDLPLTDRTAPPAEDVLLGGKRTESAVSRLALPAGFGADLPAAVHIHTAFADLDKTYRLEQGAGSSVLVTERTLAVKSNRVRVSDWPAYRRFVDEARESEPWMQLTSAGAAGEGRRPPAAGADNPAASRLLEEARQALERKDLSGATAKLDQARMLNAHQPFLWSLYGLAAERAGKPDEALADYRKEAEGHPEEGAVAQHLASLLLARKDAAGAVAVLRKAHERTPQDERTTVLLADLERRADPSAAESTLRAALRTTPDSLALKLSLGKVLVATRKRDEGVALLTTVATTAEEPGALNDAAYALADAGANLRAAEGAARRAVQLLNLAGTRRDNFPDVASALRFSLRLTAAWDTYGWVLYKEGSLSEAEPWLRAAWQDTYGQAAGTHWGLLLQKQGRSSEAARVLQALPGAERADDADLALSSDEAASAATAARSGAAGTRGLRSQPVARAPGVGEGAALFDMEYSLNSDPAVRFSNGETALAGMAGALAKVDTGTLLPPGTVAHLLRRGEVVCGSGGATCTLTMLSPRAALLH